MRAAVELVEPGMRLGLGSGRAVWATVRALGESGVRPELVVCAAPETAELAVAAGLVVAALEQAPELDLALDGADEVMRDLAVLKGGGGALLREKLVIASARRCVIVAEARKLVSCLGERWRLPVEVVRFGWHGTRLRLLELLDDAVLRAGGDGAPFVTDEGHHILDCALPPGSDLAALAAAVKAVTGVVEHGLFLDAGECGAAGRPRRLARATAQAVNCDRAAPADEGADQLRDDADVLGMVGVDLEPVDVVELHRDREARVALAQAEVGPDGDGAHLGERGREGRDGRGDRVDLVGRRVGLELEGDDVMQHAATVAAVPPRLRHGAQAPAGAGSRRGAKSACTCGFCRLLARPPALSRTRAPHLLCSACLRGGRPLAGRAEGTGGRQTDFDPREAGIYEHAPAATGSARCVGHGGRFPASQRDPGLRRDRCGDRLAARRPVPACARGSRARRGAGVLSCVGAVVPSTVIR